LGFISAYKGLEFLIEAVKDLPYFLLIGGGYFTTGPDTLYIQKKKEETAQKLGKRCRWIGYVADHDLAKIYAAMDVVVYPSRFATESGALIMALGHGKAVIASNVSPFREKQEQGALMIFDDVDDLRTKIKALIENPELRIQLESGARRFVEETSWDIVAKQHLKVYENLLDSGV